MMAAAVLHKGTTILHNVPRIQDVFCMMGILEYIGCVCSFEGHTLIIDAGAVSEVHIPEEYVRQMRSSIILLGALLGRMGEAFTQYPGGCSIGKRPVDLHLYALSRLGAEIVEGHSEIAARAAKLTGGIICFSYPSVGATENAILGAVLADGVTEIHGAAREPEITELCRFLENMGAEVDGAGTCHITVRGNCTLHDSVYCVPGDRIVAGTYLLACLACGGDIRLLGTPESHMKAVLDVCHRAGAVLEPGIREIWMKKSGKPCAMDIATAPYPGYPTDLQSPMLVVMSVADGESQMAETVFEGRYATAEELVKMGARIRIEGERAYVSGTEHLHGAEVEAKDLRGGAALVLAGMAAEGTTCISQYQHIARGYEDICADLAAVGQNVCLGNQNEGKKQ